MHKRVLGLDIGTKRVGVAVSDALGFTAQGLPTLIRGSLRADLATLASVVKEYDITRIVAGLPLNMNGSEGPRAQKTREFGDAVAKATALEILYWDERLTTVAAERALIEGNVSREKRKGLIDQVAATLILQGWLDSQPEER